VSAGLRDWAATIAGDVATLRASWGGWRAAWQDARQLIRHRRVLVDTSVMTPAGAQVVLRTRLRLIGDTQTDILRGWLDAAASKDLDDTVRTHFETVAAAMHGWAAMRAMERVLILSAWCIGLLFGAATTVQKFMALPISDAVLAVFTRWHLWAGLAPAVLGHLIRWLLRLRLRAVFHHAISGL
jgi:hypothetical protein